MHRQIYLLYYIFCFAFAVVLDAKAQTDSTKFLQEVQLTGFSLQEYAIGTKHTTIDSLAYRQGSGQTLAQTLMEQSGIYMKQYGASGIASVSFRGTGAGHTAVLWNGLPINSFTLGEMDFNNVPLASASKVIISHGAGSSVFGSGSIGGTIQMLSALPTQAQKGLSGQLWGGSFGNVGGQLAYTTRQKWWALRQSIFAQTAQNDFSFVNIAKFDKPTERQQNAQNTFKGMQTEVYFFPHKAHTLSLHAWLQSRDMQFAPTMGANLQTHLYTKAEEKNNRFLLHWKYAGRQGQEFELRAGYIHDFYLYNRTDSTQTQTYIFTAQHKTRLTPKLHARINSSHTFIVAFADNYAGTKREARQDISAGLHWQPLNRLSIALNVTQMWVEARRAPFTPSLAGEYRAGKVWRIKAYMGRTYRVPTLNDRFWNVGGNPSLRPENGFSTELGLQYTQKRERLQLQLELTPYLLAVRDWILWIPTDVFWTPENIRTVQARGIEGQASVAWKKQHFQLQSGLAYAHTQSRTEQKQLAYTPLHRASTWLQLTYKTWSFYQNFNFTSFRYTNLNNTDFLPAFMLLNASIAKSFQIQKYKISLQCRLNNVLNLAYQNYEKRAMAGRNYVFSLLIN